MEENTGIPQATQVLEILFGRLESRISWVESRISLGEATVSHALDWKGKALLKKLSRPIRKAVANWHTIFDAQLWVEFCDQLDSWAKDTVSLWDLSDLLGCLLEEALFFVGSFLQILMGAAFGTFCATKETAYEEATDSVNKFHLHQMYSKLHHCFPVLASLDEKTGIPQATEVLDKIIGKVKSSNKSIGNARVGELNWAEKSRFQQLSRSIRQAVANWHTIFDSQLWVEFCDHLDSWAKNTVSLYDLSDLLDSLLEEARYVLALEEQRKKEDSWNLQVAETDRKLTAEFDRKLKQMELKILAGNQRSEQLEGELSRMKVQLKGLQDDKLKMTKELQDVKSENEDMTLQAMTVSAELKELKNESLMHTEAHKKLEDQRRKTDEAMDLACHGAEIVERVQVLETTLMKMSAELLELKSNNQVRSMKTESENLQLQRDLLNLKKDLHEVNVKCARTGVNDRVKMKKNDVNEFKSTMHHAKYQMWQIEDKESSDASSDASWVRIQQRVETSMLHSASSGFSIDTSGPRCFMPDALFKAPDGKLLSGADLYLSWHSQTSSWPRPDMLHHFAIGHHRATGSPRLRQASKW